jgi:hypothetical protein
MARTAAQARGTENREKTTEKINKKIVHFAGGLASVALRVLRASVVNLLLLTGVL